MTTQTANVRSSLVLNLLRKPAALLVLASVLGFSAPASAGTTHASVEGSLEKAVVREVVRANIDDVRDCYNAELIEDETVAGRVVVSFEIQPDGSVSKADVSESTMPERFDACMERAVTSWSFPAAGETTSVLYPFEMHPA